MSKVEAVNSRFSPAGREAIRRASGSINTAFQVKIEGERLAESDRVKVVQGARTILQLARLVSPRSTERDKTEVDFEISSGTEIRCLTMKHCRQYVRLVEGSQSGEISRKPDLLAYLDTEEETGELKSVIFYDERNLLTQPSAVVRIDNLSIPKDDSATL